MKTINTKVIMKNRKEIVLMGYERLLPDLMAYYFSTAEITVYRKLLLDSLIIYYKIISKSSHNTSHANLKARIDLR